jgi:hypothetical protein
MWYYDINNTLRFHTVRVQLKKLTPRSTQILLAQGFGPVAPDGHFWNIKSIANGSLLPRFVISVDTDGVLFSRPDKRRRRPQRSKCHRTKFASWPRITLAPDVDAPLGSWVTL